MSNFISISEHLGLFAFSRVVLSETHCHLRVEFVYQFPLEYKHDREQIPLAFIDMIRKCPLHTVKVSPLFSFVRIYI